MEIFEEKYNIRFLVRSNWDSINQKKIRNKNKKNEKTCAMIDY